MAVATDIQEQARSSDADVRQKAAQVLARSAADDDLPLMFELLGDRDWRVRKTIVDGVLRDPRQSVMRQLLRALHDGDNAGKRNSATEALIRVGQDAIPYIIWELGREQDSDVRLSLINLMGDLRNDDGYEVLLALLFQETDINLLSSVVASLGRYRRASSIVPLLRVLQSNDLWLKFHVIDALGEIGDRTALPAILPLYSEKSLRKPILEAIGKIADVGSVGFLLRIIAQDEKLNLTALRSLIRIAEAAKPRVVEEAERSLIQRKFRDSFPKEKIVQLVEHLRSTPKRDVKNFIVKILGWTADPRALPVLLDVLEEPESAETAATALVDFGPASSSAVLEKLRSTDEDEITALLLRVIHANSGAEAIPAVVEFLDHENPMIRRLAIEIIGGVPEGGGAIDYLLAKLDDPDVACQQAAVDAVTTLAQTAPGTRRSLMGKIKRLLDSPSTPVKVNSLSIFVNVQGEGHDHELLLASKDSDPVIRQKAVSLMGRFSEEHFTDQLLLSLADESTGVRVAAIQAIVAVRPARGIRPLISALEDEDIWIRTAAAHALGEYRADSAIPALVRHLHDDAPPVRIAVIEALGKIRDERVSNVLLDVLDSGDPEIQRAALLALAGVDGDPVFERLVEHAYSEDWRLRAAAAAALGRRGDHRALDEIHRLISSDPDTYVQQSAVVALETLADRSSFPLLFDALDNRSILDDVIELLVKRHDLFRDLLEQAWRTADSRHEVIIATILQAIKGRATNDESADIP